MTSKEKARKAIPHLMLALKTLATSEFSFALNGDILLAALLKRKETGKVKYTDTLDFVTTEKTGDVEREKTFLLTTLDELGYETVGSDHSNHISFRKLGEETYAHINLHTDIQFKNEGNETLFSYPVRHLSVEEGMSYLTYMLSNPMACGRHVVDYYLYLEMGYSLPAIKVKMFLDKHNLKLGNFSILEESLIVDDVYDGLDSEDIIREKVKRSLSKVIASSPLGSSPVTQSSISVATEPKGIAETVQPASDEAGVFQLNHKAVPEEGKPIPVHIRDRILELADMVQPWGQCGGKVVKFLKTLKNRGDYQNIIYFRFWEEVSTAFFGKTIFREVELYQHYESKFRKNNDPFFDIHKASRTDNGYYTWMRLNKRYFDFVQPTLDAVYDIKESVGRDIHAERTVFTDETLRFIYKKAGEITTEKEFFSVLPLIQWAIENLLVSKKDNLLRHKDALVKVFIHGMLKHTNAANQLLTLLNEVDSYLLSPEIPTKHDWSESNIFVKEKSKEEISTERAEEQFAPVAMAEACNFVQVLSRVLEGADTREMPIEIYRRDFRATPFIFIYRYLITARQLGVLDTTFFPITKDHIDKLYLEQEGRQELFSEKNIEAQILRVLLLLEEEEEYNVELWTPENLRDLKKQALRAAEVMSISKLISNETYSELITKINRLAGHVRERIEVYKRAMVDKPV